MTSDFSPSPNSLSLRRTIQRRGTVSRESPQTKVGEASTAAKHVESGYPELSNVDSTFTIIPPAHDHNFQATPIPAQRILKKTTVGDLLMETAGTIKKAYDMLKPVNRRKANELGRLSNEVYKIFLDLPEDELELYIEEPDNIPSSAPPPAQYPVSESVPLSYRQTPTYPPGLPIPANSMPQPGPEPMQPKVVPKRVTEPYGTEGQIIGSRETIQPAPLSVSIQRTKVQALDFPSLGSTIQHISLSPSTGKARQVATWATIAASQPSAGSEAQAPHSPSSNYTPGFNSTSIMDYATAVQSTIEAEADQKRVVIVKGCQPSLILKDVTKHITEGPLMSILITKESPAIDSLSACIIFMLASHARAFIDKISTATTRTGQGLYGTGTSVLQGELWPEDDEIRAMRVHYERRRLTFAAGGLFQRVSRDEFKADVEEIAGAANIELIWLFNTGNATVVFASVRVARAVKKGFMTRGDKSSYQGLRISFCADPCEKEMRLVSQMLTGPEAAAGRRGKKR